MGKVSDMQIEKVANMTEEEYEAFERSLDDRGVPDNYTIQPVKGCDHA